MDRLPPDTFQMGKITNFQIMTWGEKNASYIQTLPASPSLQENNKED